MERYRCIGQNLFFIRKHYNKIQINLPWDGFILSQTSPWFKILFHIQGADSIDIRTELPTIFPTGVTLSLKKNKDDELQIIVNTNREAD